jgi:FtsH-binding integral membrane protein
MANREISIWFFIGVSLLVNGVVICGAGIYEYVNPPVEKVVLYNLHAGIWWGAILAVVGLLYCIFFAPTKRDA